MKLKFYLISILEKFGKVLKMTKKNYYSKKNISNQNSEIYIKGSDLSLYIINQKNHVDLFFVIISIEILLLFLDIS
jgi:hypothetical protein